MIGPAMLFCDDVFDVEGEKRIVVLMHPAIFTTITGASPNQTSSCGVHQDFLASRSRALACKIAMKSANAI